MDIEGVAGLNGFGGLVTYIIPDSRMRLDVESTGCTFYRLRLQTKQRIKAVNGPCSAVGNDDQQRDLATATHTLTSRGTV
jgi:hypothetical protein